MFKKNKNIFAFLKNNKKGLSLVELIVTIAILAVVSAIAFSSYTNVMEEQRMRADMATLSNIDIGLKQILLYDDAFEEIKKCVQDKNKVYMTFYVVENAATGYSYVDLSQTIVGTGESKLCEKCPTVYQYLVEHVGDRIDMASINYKNGSYRIEIKFNGSQISDIRDYAITNDVIDIENSGDNYLTR